MMAFKCRYLLNGDCQLYSKKCEAGCEQFSNCSVCKYKLKSMGCEPCVRCDELEGGRDGRDKRP